MDKEMEAKRSQLLKNVFSMTVAFGDYFTAAKLCTDYQDLFGYSLVTAARNAGYVSVDDMLSKSSNIESVYIQAKKHYRVVKSAGSEATQNISALIKQQGKKKKRNAKINTSEREYLNRNVSAARSFRTKSNYGAGFVHPLRETFFDNLQQAQPIHGPPKGFKLPQCSSTRGTTADNSGSKVDKIKTGTGATNPPNSRYAASSSSGPTSLPSTSRAAVNKQKSSENSFDDSRLNRSPAVGVERFLKALRACGGSASSDQLRKTYKKIHNVDWDPAECYKYFGTNSTRDIVEIFLKDLVEIVVVKGTGRRTYVLLENSTRQKVDKPNNVPAGSISTAELHDGLVDILLEMHPKTLHVRSLTKVLLDKYGVAVEPETSLNLSWEKYISKFFSGQIEVDNEGNVSLNENDPLLHDKILKKWTIDALEAPIGSGFDSSFDSTDSTTVNSLDDRQDGQRSRSDEDVIVYVDQSGGASHRGSESRMPFDRFSKVSRSFHGVTKETAFFDHACDDCSDLAGADLASVEPRNVRVTVPSGTSERRIFLSGRPSEPSSSTSEVTSNFVSSAEELPPRIKSLSSNLVQRLSINRWLTQKAFAPVRNFYKRNIDSVQNFEPASVSRTAFPVNNPELEGRQFSGNHSRQAQEDVECNHPYYNVHCISKDGDARVWAAKKGLTIKSAQTQAKD